MERTDRWSLEMRSEGHPILGWAQPLGSLHLNPPWRLLGSESGWPVQWRGAQAPFTQLPRSDSQSASLPDMKAFKAPPCSMPRLF